MLRTAIAAILACAAAVMAGSAPPPQELKRAMEAATVTKTKGDTIAILLLPQASNDVEREISHEMVKTFGKVADNFPEHSCAFFWSSAPEVIKRYAKQTEGQLPALVVVSFLDKNGRRKKNKKTHMSNLKKSDFVDQDRVGHFILRTTLPVAQAVPGDGSKEMAARMTLLYKNQMPRLLMYSNIMAISYKNMAIAEKFKSNLYSAYFYLPDNKHGVEIIDKMIPSEFHVQAIKGLQESGTFYFLRDGLQQADQMAFTSYEDDVEKEIEDHLGIIDHNGIGLMETAPFGYVFGKSRPRKMVMERTLKDELKDEL